MESSRSAPTRVAFRGSLLALALLVLVLIPTLHHHSIAPVSPGDQLGGSSALCGLCVTGGDHVTLAYIAPFSIQATIMAGVAFAPPAWKQPAIEAISSRGPPHLLFV